MNSLRNHSKQMPHEYHQDFKQHELIGELSLSWVFAVKTLQYPWLILVPKRASVWELFDLSTEDQIILWNEIHLLSKALKSEFKTDHINIGSIGNVTQVLHIHIVGRFFKDPIWPKPVWGASLEGLEDYEGFKNYVQKFKKMLLESEIG